MAALMKLVPMSQITYGTDYPYFPLDQIDNLRQLNLPAADLDAIASGNADECCRAAAAAGRVHAGKGRVVGARLAARRAPSRRRGASAGPAPPAPAQAEVAIALVLAVDTSGSVGSRALRVAEAGLRGGVPQSASAQRDTLADTQSIAVTMVQWTGPRLHVRVVDWTLIKDEASADAFAAAIEAAPAPVVRRRHLDQRRHRLFAPACWRRARSTRRAPRHRHFGRRFQQQRPSGDQARDEAVRDGVGINGLPILSIEPILDRYYYDNVIGGPGAFMIPAENYDTFADAS